MVRPWLGLCLLIAGASCHRHARGTSAYDGAAVDKIRATAESFLHDQVEQSWERWLMGTSRNPNLPVSGREWLLTPASLDVLRRAVRREPKGDNRRALRYLHALLVGEQVKLATVDADLRLWALSRRPVDTGPEPTTFRDLSTRLSHEPDAMRRRVLSEAALPVLVAMAPILAEREVRVRKVAHTLGYDDRLLLSSELRQYDARQLEPLARSVLDETEALYLSLLSELAQTELGLRMTALRPADIPRLLAAPRFDTAFPADGMLEVAEATVADLGIDLASLPIRIDARPLSSKHPRPACFPVSVPTDIRLSVKPAGGAADYAALLHELGHALHFAKTRTVVFELQVLGDASSSEALAFLFETLVDDPAWLAEHLGMREPTLKDYMRLVVLKRLLMVRRYAARVLVSMAAQSPKQVDPRPLYRDLMSRAYGFPLDDADVAHALVDQDPFLEAGDYVRGWVVAASLSADFKKRFGARWWHDKAAAARLQELWAAGQRDNAAELARQVTGADINTEALNRWAAETVADAPTPELSRDMPVPSGHEAETR